MREFNHASSYCTKAQYKQDIDDTNLFGASSLTIAPDGHFRSAFAQTDAEKDQSINQSTNQSMHQ
jgi:6-phosphogluconolactonase/glucosamine-6-phosphate isomerase/deaminase